MKEVEPIMMEPGKQFGCSDATSLHFCNQCFPTFHLTTHFRQEHPAGQETRVPGQLFEEHSIAIAGVILSGNGMMHQRSVDACKFEIG